MFTTRFLRAKMILLMLVSLHAGVFAQLKAITGVVKNDQGALLEKATISGTGAKDVLTSADGTFSISVPEATNSLQVSFTEYGIQKISIKGKTNIIVVLRPTIAVLDSVVVIGYGTQKRRDVTGAISSIKGDAIKDLPVQNVAEALQGRMAGVEVTKSSGEPGTTAQITIRGVTSFMQQAPLYVIDGVRQDQSFGATAGANINPQDIANIDVLKDASSKAIYGAAGSGGVILITTKKGQGAPTINFNARYGITKPRILDLLGKDDFIKIKQMTDPAGYYALNNQLDTLPNTDWVDAIFRDGIEQNYNISVTGSTPAVNYYVSGLYNNEKGVYLNNSSSIYDFKVNTDIRVTKHIKVGEQIDGWQRQTSPVDYGPGGATLSPRINPPFRTVPTMEIYGKEPGEWGTNPSGFSGPNIVGQILSKRRSLKQSNIQANTYAEIKLPLSLTLRGTLGYTLFNSEGNDYEGVLRTQVDAVTSPQLLRNFESYKNLLTSVTLTHDKSYGKHNLNVLIGYEQYQGIYSGLFTAETNAGGTGYAYISTSNSILSINNGGYDPNPLTKSIFGRINYNYDNKYFLSAAVREDEDFLKFGPTHAAGEFPSASLGWRLSEEDFVKKALPMFNLLKLRASYGASGNNNIPGYVYNSVYDIVNQQAFTPGGTPILGYSQLTLPNPDIKWETTYETNIGVDAEVFGGKLFFSVDWYKKRTADLIYKLPIPISGGLSTPNEDPAHPPKQYFNIGTSRNTGVDILLGYKNEFKTINYAVTFTGTFNKNKVSDLGGIDGRTVKDGNNNYGTSQGTMFGQDLTYTATGLPFGQFYGFKVLGIRTTDQTDGPQYRSRNALAGDLIYQDVNGDGIINDDDRTVIGNPNPKFAYGLNLNVNWKGFDLALLFNGVAGVDIFNGVAPYAQSLWSDGNTTSKVFNASYLGTNGLTSQPRIGELGANGISFTPDALQNQNYSVANSYFVEKGNYLKLKNLQVGYNFASKFLSKAKIRNARLFVMANNLFTITKYSGIDPEIGSQDLSLNGNGGTTNRGIDSPYKYPSTRVYSFGLNLTF